MLGATVGLVALTGRARRAYMWLLLFSGLSASVLGNGAHSSGGPELLGPITLHRLGSALPALGLASMLHTLLLLVRPHRAEAKRAAPEREGSPPPARPPRPAAARILALKEREPPATTGQIAAPLNV